jgi:Rieske Fe-S protein
VAGLLLGALIREGAHPWSEIYDPSRKSVRAALEFAKENLNVAAQYTDWASAGDAPSATSIEPGRGCVVRRGVSKLAVYRDAHGTMHERSAVCPHLGCIVSWNSGEESWDCPCHGSRFDAMGRLLNGPAKRSVRTRPGISGSLLARREAEAHGAKETSHG